MLEGEKISRFMGKRINDIKKCKAMFLLRSIDSVNE